MERTERYLRIQSKKEPTWLYCPAAYTALRVKFGEVYRITMSDVELKRLIDSGLAKIAEPGTFSNFYALVHFPPRLNTNGYQWERQTA